MAFSGVAILVALAGLMLAIKMGVVIGRGWRIYRLREEPDEFWERTLGNFVVAIVLWLLVLELGPD